MVCFTFPLDVSGDATHCSCLVRLAWRPHSSILTIKSLSKTLNNLNSCSSMGPKNCSKRGCESPMKSAFVPVNKDSLNPKLTTSSCGLDNVSGDTSSLYQHIYCFNNNYKNMQGLQLSLANEISHVQTWT